MDDDAAGGDDAQSSSRDAAKAVEPRPARIAALAGRRPSRRQIGLFIATMAFGSIIAINMVLIFTGSRARDTTPATRLSARTISDASRRFMPPTTTPAPALEAAEPLPAMPVPDEPRLADDPPLPEPKRTKHPGTVHEASARSCSTSSVGGLSRQIIAQARCIDADAFVQVPARPNLVTGAHVFLYMEASARDRLVSLLDAHPDRIMTVNSALRTVAQQYLVWRWAANRRCGVQLATPPGESNHETGLALDIAEAARWRSDLEASGFRWLGAIDKVHFDYRDGRAEPHHIDVKAFQQLWNHAHPDDTIEESGGYSAATHQRLKSAPAGGFAVVPRCDRAPRTGGGGFSRVLAR